jgi:DNA/RNA endonuclease YhcR with UshA esterase domain
MFIGRPSRQREWAARRRLTRKDFWRRRINKRKKVTRHIFVAAAGQNASNVCMKAFLSILAVLALTLEASAADTNAAAPLKIGTADADKYYDQTMIVTGKVAQVTIRPTVTFLNLDQPFPNSPFTVAIFHGHSSFYGDANALRGKSIELKGKIKNYNDKPEIALDSTNQLTVFDSKGVNITSTILQSTNHAPVMLQTPNAVPATPALPATNFPEIM